MDPSYRPQPKPRTVDESLLQLKYGCSLAKVRGVSCEDWFYQRFLKAWQAAKEFDDNP